MDRVIKELRACSEEVPVPLDLPDMDDIINAEEQLLVSLDNDFRHFLLTVSDVIYGTLEPVTVADPNAHTYLPEVAAQAWAAGLPRNYIPLCEDRGNYYCTNELGEVHYFCDGKIKEDEPWANVWQWAEHVWLNC